MTQFKVTLYWDAVPLAEQYITDNGQGLDLAKWRRIDWRLNPLVDHLFVNPSFRLHESTFFRITLERVDSKGRRLTR